MSFEEQMRFARLTLVMWRLEAKRLRLLFKAKLIAFALPLLLAWIRYRRGDRYAERTKEIAETRSRWRSQFRGEQ